MYICACALFIPVYICFPTNNFKKENWLANLYVAFPGLVCTSLETFLFVGRVWVRGTSLGVACSDFWCWISHVYKRLYFFLMMAMFILISILVLESLLESILIWLVHCWDQY